VQKAVVILDSLIIVRRSALPRRDDLRTWFRDGTASASEVAKIDNGTNSLLNEEPRSDLGR
jgi:hypothetical protein